MKKNQAFCTIVTNNYFSWALTLYDSLEKFDKDVILYVAIIDKTVSDHSSKIQNRNIKIVTIDDLKDISFANQIINKYADSVHVLRWSLKSILVLKVLESHEKAIFIDADIYFFNSYQFLFDSLDNSDVILTPHWRPSKQTIDRVGFETNFKHGLYNAGFIGANKNGTKALEFWAESCFNFCGKNIEVGLYHDQTYLNLLPIYFENVSAVRNKGCNLGSWNIDECKRTQDPVTKEVRINGKDPVVFVHFSNVTIDTILKKTDPFLEAHLYEFNSTLIKNGFRDVIAERLAYFQKLTKEANENIWQRTLRKTKLIYYKIRY